MDEGIWRSYPSLEYYFYYYLRSISIFERRIAHTALKFHIFFSGGGNIFHIPITITLIIYILLLCIYL